MPVDYLKDEQDYIDLYDLLTIKECLRHRESQIKIPEVKNKNRARRLVSLVNDVSTYYIKGNNYLRKRETIDKWMNDDRIRDQIVEKATPPESVICPHCGYHMQATSKDLYLSEIENAKVLFFFGCPNCDKKKGVFDNGEEFAKDSKCPECNSTLNEKMSRKGNVITTLSTCPYCSYKNTDVWDIDKSDKEHAKGRMEDRKLLEKYRKEFCMSEKEGREYATHAQDMKNYSEMTKERETKENDPAYHRAMKLKKLKIVELEKLLVKVLEKEKYVKLALEKPEMERFVIVPFTVQDADTSRKEYDSTNNLKKLIKRTLENTNWRLMSDDPHYRLGYLSGRLKGYENEEDLMELVRKKKEREAKNHLVMIDNKEPLY